MIKGRNWSVFRVFDRVVELAVFRLVGTYRQPPRQFAANFIIRGRGEVSGLYFDVFVTTHGN